MDILQPLPLKDWPCLLEQLKVSWPDYACIYNWVLNAQHLRNKEPNIPYDIYCPNGILKDTTFIGISSIDVPQVCLSTFEESGETLKKCLLETKLLIWEKPLLFVFMKPNIQQICEFVQKEKQKIHGFNYGTDKTTYCFKSKEECANIEIGPIPEGFEVRQLSVSDIPMINSIWPHREKHLSHNNYFEKVILHNRCPGIYDVKNNKLASWVLHGSFGGLQALQTAEEYKKRGLARLVVKIVSKKLATEEPKFDTNLFIVDKNVPSENLFKSLDFKNCGITYWSKTHI